ncbi:MAG: hypothetical protein M3Y41_13730 [Pseudomonadota bacterium]|nr:hypothetical protein [Pseudomonadota bacterium]
MKKLAILAVTAMLPVLAYAQPAAPTAADRAAIAMILNQIITLQQQQLLALQQLAQPRPILDDRRACVLSDQGYTEGAPAKAVDGKIYVCTRVYPTTGQEHERLVWAPAS